MSSNAPPSGPRESRGCEELLGFWTAALVLLASGLGCASSCPRYDDQHWRELSTANFRLRTDSGEAEARAKLNELEMFRAALLTSFHAPPTVHTGQVPVVVLDEGWGAVGGPLLHGFFTHALFSPQIAMRGGSNLLGQIVVKHELVHYFSRRIRPHDPRWLTEGLAMYFETLEISDDHHLVTVGRPDPHDVLVLRHYGIRSVEDLLSRTNDRTSAGVFDSSAWLLVHYLMNHRNEAFRAYLKALAAGAKETQAWTTSFGDLTPELLDLELKHYFDGGQYYLYQFPFQPPQVPILAERALLPADGHATRALLYAVMSGQPSSDVLPSRREEYRACACQELAETFRDNADHTLGLAVKTWALNEEIDVARAQRSADRAPTDWMAWWLLADTLRRHGGDGQDADAAATKAVNLMAGDPAVDLKDLKVVRHVK